jgi:hypothetical protein
MSNSYIIKPKVIGSGYYGKVLLGENKAQPDIKVAIKAI